MVDSSASLTGVSGLLSGDFVMDVGNRTVDDMLGLEKANPDLVTQKQPTDRQLPKLPDPSAPLTPAPPSSQSPHRPQPSRPTADSQQATRVPDSIDGYAANFSFMMGGPAPRPRPSARADAAGPSGQRPEIHDLGSDPDNIRDDIQHLVETLNTHHAH